MQTKTEDEKARGGTKENKGKTEDMPNESRWGPTENKRQKAVGGVRGVGTARSFLGEPHKGGRRISISSI